MPGALHRRPALAETLETIAQHGLPARTRPASADTVYLCAVDRGTGFVLEPGHPNRLAPGNDGIALGF